MGIHRSSNEIYEYMHALSDRMRRVRVCCGDWSRVCGDAPTIKQGLTAVFLDPPYSHEVRDSDLYAVEDDSAAKVRQWCHERGQDKKLRIILCGYAGEGHESLEDDGWKVVQWKARGGYGTQNGKGLDNSHKERMWISPHCVFTPKMTQRELAID